MKPFYKYILLLLLAIFTFNYIVGKPYRGPGRTWFEKAYKLEKKDPKTSLSYYRKSLSLGLNPELRKAAKWRLFYLLKDLKKYDLAIKQIPTLGGVKNVSKLKNNIVRDAARYYRINNQDAKTYIKGLGLNRTGKFANNIEIQNKFQKLFLRYKNNIKFKKQLTIISQNNQLSLRTFDSINNCDSMDCQIMNIDLLIANKKYSKAIAECFSLSKSPSLSKQQKFQILYKLGKSYKHKRKTYLAIRYYRLAARYAKSNQEEKVLALAAFSLYELGLKRQARYLARNLHKATQTNLHIFHLILKIDLDNDLLAKQELVKLKPLLIQKKKEGKSKSLVNAALKLIN